jgi:hypothetical protein
MRYFGPLCGKGASAALKGALDSSSFCLALERSAGEGFTPEAFLLARKAHTRTVAAVTTMVPTIITEMIITPLNSGASAAHYMRTVRIAVSDSFQNDSGERGGE